MSQHLYVAPDGHDHNSGTAHAPLATLYGACEHAGSGATITLLGGTHFLQEPVVLTPRHSGLTLCAAEGERVRLSGGVSLELNWQRAEGGLWSAPVPEPLAHPSVAFDQLFVNGVRQTLARYPNFDPNTPIFGGTAADALSPGRVARWHNPVGGFVHTLHTSGWGDDHWRITGKDGSALELEGGWMNNRPSPIHPEHRYVENIFEELDSPGEWFFDREASRLWFYPPEDLDPSTAEITTTRLENLLELRGDEEDAPVRDITLRGLTLTHTARTFMKTREALLRSDWCIYRGGSVLLSGTEGCRVEDCTFEAPGGNALFISGYNRHATVSSCHIYEAGGNGICVVGLPEAVRSPLFRYEESLPLEAIDPTPGPSTNAYPADITIEDCLIHDLGTFEKQIAGVQIQMAARVTVRHCSIYNLPRAGINIGDGCWGGHLIEGCDVFETVLMTEDHGAFNSWGRDRYWHPDYEVMGEHLREHPELATLDSTEVTTLRHNRFRCDHGWDIDLDDGSSVYEIIGNVCLGGGIKLREGVERRVEHNILVRSTFHPHVWFEDSRDVFCHNIVALPYAPIRLLGWGERIDSNLFMNEAGLEAARTWGTDATSRVGDPQFIDPEAGDYRVPDTSPAHTLGFRNPPTTAFGVRTPALRRRALSAPIPQGAPQPTRQPQPITRTWAGAVVRPLHGLGERSAAGLDSERGLVVETLSQDSPAQRLGLQAGDVILQIASVPATSPEQLPEPDHPIHLEIFRQQRVMTIASDLQGSESHSTNPRHEDAKRGSP